MATGTLPESHHQVALELINMIRSLLRGPRYEESNQRVAVDVLHKLFESALETDFDESDLTGLIGVFAVLGKEVIPWSQNGSAIAAGSIVRIQVASKSLVADPQIPGGKKFVPATRVPASPNLFELTAAEFAVIQKVQDWIAELRNPTFVQSILMVHFSSFLTISLQFDANMAGFLEHVDLSKFSDWAMGRTSSSLYRSVFQLSHLIGQIAADLINWEDRSGGSRAPYSLAKESRPTVFQSIAGGYVSCDMLVSFDAPSLFVGDLPVIGEFYYELTILENRQPRFLVGFLDRDSLSTNVRDCRLFGVDWALPRLVSGELQADANTPLLLTQNNVVGCAFVSNTLLYYLNGDPLPMKVPVPNVRHLVPCVCLRSGTRLRYNMGQLPFCSDARRRLELWRRHAASAPVSCHLPAVAFPETSELSEYGRMLQNDVRLWQTTAGTPGIASSEFIPEVAVGDSRAVQVPEVSFAKSWASDPTTLALYLGQPVVLHNKQLVGRIAGFR
jgi:hypothetical protein